MKKRKTPSFMDLEAELAALKAERAKHQAKHDQSIAEAGKALAKGLARAAPRKGKPASPPTPQKAPAKPAGKAPARPVERPKAPPPAKVAPPQRKPAGAAVTKPPERSPFYEEVGQQKPGTEPRTKPVKDPDPTTKVVKFEGGRMQIQYRCRVDIIHDHADGTILIKEITND